MLALTAAGSPPTRGGLPAGSRPPVTGLSAALTTPSPGANTPVPTSAPERSAPEADRSRASRIPGRPGNAERLTIPALGVSVPLVPLERTSNNGMGAPADAQTAGWDAPGPMPGSSGNALVAAHRDLGGRPGPFWRLETLQPGDAVVVVLSGGRRVEFVVTRVQAYDVDQAPLAEIFAPSRKRQLTLITCGGTFDRRRGDYLQRVVVTARPRNV